MVEYTYGDSVRVSKGAPAELRPGSYASVVALGTPNRPELTIEYDDGSDAEVLPELLEPFEDE